MSSVYLSEASKTSDKVARQICWGLARGSRFPTAVMVQMDRKYIYYYDGTIIRELTTGRASRPSNRLSK
eukprot:SAG11_NODE_38063_length_254_cov_0.658065_1_plen_68_part_10